jgi:CRISPR-associated protein Cas1
VVFLNKYGDPFARVWQAKMGSTAAIRRRQIEVAEAAEGLMLVLDWCRAKVRNQIEFLEELRGRRPESPSAFEQSLNGMGSSQRR